MRNLLDLDAVRFDTGTGTVVVVAQDAATGRVLMVANADRDALEHTIRSGEMHYRSRRRGLWRKGGTSGNVQKVVSLDVDCDGDTVLARVISSGPACHTGNVSCFPDSAHPGAWAHLASTIRDRHESGMRGDAPPDGRSYTSLLLTDRNLRLKKIGEESAELIAACADGDRDRATEEAADLVYHLAVALEAVGTSLDAVGSALFNRSSAAEKERSIAPAHGSPEIPEA